MRGCRRFWNVLLLACPLCAGCLGGYAYPTVAYIPPASLGKPAASEVHAFRVDILDVTGSIDFSTDDEYRFSEVSVNARGDVPSQTSVGIGRGWWGLFGALSYHQRLHPTIRVRLYRPGYESVERKPWERDRPIDWKIAATVEAREKAIDDLISTTETNEHYRIAPGIWKNERADYGLGAPKTDGQRAALLLVAGEYDRLSSEATGVGDRNAADRLQEKGRQLRTLALE